MSPDMTKAAMSRALTEKVKMMAVITANTM